MKKIVLIYWTWHISLILIAEYAILPLGYARYVGCLIILNLAYVILSTSWYNYISGKRTYSDNKYYKVYLASVVSRFMTMVIGVAFGTIDIKGLLFLNGLTILFYYVINKIMTSVTDGKLVSVYEAMDKHNIEE